MATNIPLPGLPWESFNKGMESGSSTLARLMNAKNNKQRTQQQQQELEMKQQLLPHQIQALVDAHVLNPYQAKELQARAQNLSAEAQKNTLFANLLGGNGQSEGSYQPMQMQPHGMQEGPNQEQGQVPTELVNQFPQMAPQQGNEIVVRNGNPNLSKLDNAPGLMGIPAVQHHTDENGNTFSYYPSGKVTMIKTGRSAEEKAALELEKQGKQKTQELQIKEREDIHKGLPVLEDRLKNAKQLLELMNKHKDKSNEWWGSPLPFQSEDSALKMRKMKVKDKDFGKIETGYAEIAKDLSKDLSNNRVLASGLQFSIRNKSSFTEPYEVAKGKLEKSIEQMEQTAKREKKRLDEISGEKDKLLETRVASDGNTYYRYANGWDTEKR